MLPDQQTPSPPFSFQIFMGGRVRVVPDYHKPMDHSASQLHFSNVVIHPVVELIILVLGVLC